VNAPLDLLNATPLAELRRRARVLARLSGTPDARLDTATVLGWENGAGDSAAWVLPGDDTALLLALDHESELNLFVEAEASDQLRMFDGVPAGLRSLVIGVPDESVFLSLGEGPAAAPVASAVAFLHDGVWSLSPGLLALCARRGLDPVVDSGLAFCLHEYLLGDEFSVEALSRRDPERRWGIDAAGVEAAFRAAGV
jgi:hypothetical protein